MSRCRFAVIACCRRRLRKLRRKLRRFVAFRNRGARESKGETRNSEAEDSRRPLEMADAIPFGSGEKSLSFLRRRADDKAPICGSHARPCRGRIYTRGFFDALSLALSFAPPLIAIADAHETPDCETGTIANSPSSSYSAVCVRGSQRRKRATYVTCRALRETRSRERLRDQTEDEQGEAVVITIIIATGIPIRREKAQVTN